MSDEIKKLIQDLGEAHKAEIAEVKKSVGDKVGTEAVLKLEKATADTLAKFDNIEKHVSKMEEKLASVLEKAGAHDAQKLAQSDEVTKAYNKLLLRGEQSLSADERAVICKAFNIKTIVEGNDEAGGFFIRPTFSNIITQATFDSSPIRQIASVQSINGNQWVEFYNENQSTINRRAELETITETNTPTFKEIRIHVHEMNAEPAISREALEDGEGINFEQFVSAWLARDFSLKEGADFVNGDGNKKARGFLTYAAGSGFNKLEQINTGHATNITYEGLVDLVDSLLDPFQANARFVTNRKTRSVLRKLLDLNGRPLWEPNTQPAIPATFLGYPVMTAVDMPNLSASSLSIAFGDFRQGYKIVDKRGLTITRDDITGRRQGVVFYPASKRLGGGVVNFDAIKIQKTSA